jgi:hypothetical protein
MYDNPRSLLDQITLVHGPRDLLARYFVMADAKAREWGVRLRLRSDFDALIELNRENRDSWPPLSPAFDPAHSNLRIDSAFWLEGIDNRGETVITEMARFFDFRNTDVVEELRSLRIYYENPEPHLAAGERFEIDAPTARVVRGRTMHGGAIWVRPDWRRNGLTRIISRVSAAYALTRWDTAFTWGLVETHLHAGGLSRAYGSFEPAVDVMLHLAFRGDLPAVLLWMGREALLADLARRIAEESTVTGQRYPHQEPLSDWTVPRQR